MNPSVQNMSAPAVVMFDLRVCFDDRAILEGFSLKLHRGEKVMLSGASGSGKSTVLRCALGLVVPEHGRIRVFGEDLNPHTVWDLRRRMAYVAQEPDLGTGTVREIVERPFAYRANAALRSNLGRVAELMDRFRLPRLLLDKEIKTLSGGEKQRVALVSAILLDRELVLLDEASSALDAKNRQAVACFFREAADLTVLSVSHDAEWLNFSGRTVELTAHAGPSERGA